MRAYIHRCIELNACLIIIVFLCILSTSLHKILLMSLEFGLEFLLTMPTIFFILSVVFFKPHPLLFGPLQLTEVDVLVTHSPFFCRPLSVVVAVGAALFLLPSSKTNQVQSSVFEITKRDVDE